MKTDKNKILIGLKKAHTSLGKSIDRVEQGEIKGQEKACFDVIQQNLAVIGLLKSSNLLMLEKHIDQFISTKKKMTPRDAKKMKEEVLKIVAAAQKK